MLANLRNFGCPVTGQPCRDARCKRTRCIQDVDADALEADREKRRAANEAKLRPILETVARDVLRLAGVPHPKLEQLNNAMAHPRVRAEAERKLVDPRGKPWPLGEPKPKRRKD